MDNTQELLSQHGAECVVTVESWMRNATSLPLAVWQAIGKDPAWHQALDGLIITDGQTQASVRAISAEGVAGFDSAGNPVLLNAPELQICSPDTITDLEIWRVLVSEGLLRQNVPQLA